jgi:hypothetical protein
VSPSLSCWTPEGVADHPESAEGQHLEGGGNIVGAGFKPAQPWIPGTWVGHFKNLDIITRAFIEKLDHIRLGYPFEARRNRIKQLVIAEKGLFQPSE